MMSDSDDSFNNPLSDEEDDYFLDEYSENQLDSPNFSISGFKETKQNQEVVSEKSKSPRRPSYRIMNEESIQNEINILCNEVKQLTSLPEETCSLLLRCNGWNKEKVFNKKSY